MGPKEHTGASSKFHQPCFCLQFWLLVGTPGARWRNLRTDPQEGGLSVTSHDADAAQGVRSGELVVHTRTLCWRGCWAWGKQMAAWPQGLMAQFGGPEVYNEREAHHCEHWGHPGCPEEASRKRGVRWLLVQRRGREDGLPMGAGVAARPNHGHGWGWGQSWGGNQPREWE